MKREPFVLEMFRKLVVDLFAGGGGVSEAFSAELGIEPDIAINHSEAALSMHAANHPYTRHLIADVREVCPKDVTNGQAVGWLHLSPDCTEHSQAKGGQPRDKKIRALAWVGKRWAGQVQPDVISLENVVQILKWGPLIAKRDPETGRVVRLNGEVAAKGERVPVQEQYLIPDPKHAGRTWQAFVNSLRALGYVVEWRERIASDYGAGTKRSRLVMLARRDGLPIVWSSPTHAKNPAKGQLPLKPAAASIDFNLPSYSIFLSNEEGKAAGVRRPLADATLRRIAKGVKRYVLDCADPFIVPVQNASNSSVHSIREPLRTITSTPKGGGFALAVPCLVHAAHGEGKGKSKRRSHGIGCVTQPIGAITASGGGGGHSVAMAFLAQMNGGNYDGPGNDLRNPVSTITTTGSHQQLVSANLVEYSLSKENEAGALKVAAFLIKYYGDGGQHGDLRNPMPTMTTKDRLALVTVYLRGKPYVVVDICIRMLTPRELYNATGFPPDYQIERGHDGRKFTKAQQTHMCGNAVPPYLMRPIIRHNAPPGMSTWGVRRPQNTREVTRTKRERIAA